MPSKREKNREDREAEFWKRFAAFSLLVAVYFFVQFKYNKEKLLPSALIVLTAVLGGFILVAAYLIIINRLRWRRILKLVGRAKSLGVEDDIKHFIDRFGSLPGKKKDPWIFRNYEFDDDRLGDLLDILGAKKFWLDENQLWVLLKHYIQEKEYNLTKESVSSKPADLDVLSGPEFEILLSRLYTAAGYQVQIIGGSGDQGGDLIANKMGERILIQAKRYKGSIGNAAVQQAFTAQKHYDCTSAIVATTGTFTRGAAALAKSTNVTLFGREAIQKKLSEHLKENWR